MSQSLDFYFKIMYNDMATFDEKFAFLFLFTLLTYTLSLNFAHLQLQEYNNASQRRRFY